MGKLIGTITILVATCMYAIGQTNKDFLKSFRVTYEQKTQFGGSSKVSTPNITTWFLQYEDGKSNYYNIKQKDYKPIFKNFKIDSLFSSEWNFLRGERYFIKEKKESITWQLIQQDTLIENLACKKAKAVIRGRHYICLLYTSPSPRD